MILALLEIEPPSGLVSSDWRWIFLGGLGLAAMLVGLWQLLNPKRWPYNVDDPSTPGQEDEALACVLADPNGSFRSRVMILAGRGAIRRLRVIVAREKVSAMGSHMGRG